MPRFDCQSSNNLQAYRLLPALALAMTAAVAAAQNASPANLLPSSPEQRLVNSGNLTSGAKAPVDNAAFAAVRVKTLTYQSCPDASCSSVCFFPQAVKSCPDTNLCFSTAYETPAYHTHEAAFASSLMDVQQDSVTRPSGALIPPAPANTGSAEAQTQTWNWHMQSTIIGQGYPSLSAKYSGANSLPTAGQARETVSLDFYAGYRLWRGAEFHADLLTWQGFGLHGTLGIDDFTNGEAYKIGVRYPHTDIARFFIRQTIGFGGKKEAVPSDQLTLAGDQPVTRLTFTVGRFNTKDIFDLNAYANDPRKQFMNWALVANAVWDYPADSLGYTTGASVELKKPKWALRYGFFQLTNQQNGFTAEDQFLMWPGESSASDGRFFHDWGMVVEGERRYSIGSHPGVVRPLAFVNQGEFGSYKAALSIPGADISKTYAHRHSYGFGLNAEQEISKNIGVFSRVGWNDGHNEAWMYTDINHSGSLGISVKGDAWRRSRDAAGLAVVMSGISKVNQQFLKAGGTGILDGDGNLNYGREFALETYYDHTFPQQIHWTMDYQFVANPAFNRDRGPVSVFGTRIHWEF